jgi:two-component system NtrC family sensor kinase
MAEVIQYYLSRTRDSFQRQHRISINGLLNETLILLKPIFQQHRVQVSSTLSDTLPLLNGDDASLQRVFINLFNNAVDAMSEGGRILLVTRTGSPPDTVRPGVIIEITDTGAGIPADVLPHIFDLFMTTKAIGKGTGLGLAVCQEIIKGHEGTIDISSAVGEGSRVRVFLPTDEQQVLPLTPKENNEPADSHHG